MIQFIVKSEPKPVRQLPTIPIPIALARIAMQPVQQWRVLPVEAPSHFQWIEYTLHGGVDPIMPVPTVNFGQVFFSNMHTWHRHQRDWSHRMNVAGQRMWAEEGYKILEGFCVWLRDYRWMPAQEKGWLMQAMWSLWAEPQGPRYLKGE